MSLGQHICEHWEHKIALVAQNSGLRSWACTHRETLESGVWSDSQWEPSIPKSVMLQVKG